MLLSKRVKFLLGSAILLTVVSAASTVKAGAYLPNEPEYIYLAPTGPGGTWSFYQRNMEELSWADTQTFLANTTDTRFGTGTQAVLPIVHTPEQYDIVAQMSWAIGGNNTMWVGALRDSAQGQWYWTDGTEFYNETTSTNVNGWTGYWDPNTAQPVIQPSGTETRAIFANLDVDSMQAVDVNETHRAFYAFIALV